MKKLLLLMVLLNVPNIGHTQSTRDQLVAGLISGMVDGLTGTKSGTNALRDSEQQYQARALSERQFQQQRELNQELADNQRQRDLLQMLNKPQLYDQPKHCTSDGIGGFNCY